MSFREQVNSIGDRANRVWRDTNPDLYSAADARYALSRVGDRAYLLGTNKVNPRLNRDRSKIWSLPPELLETIKGIIKDAGHVHIAPFVMGTYQMNDQTMRMNDLCVSDPVMLGMAVTGHLEGFVSPLLRGLYYAGRPSWWRHESIHARHHHQMAYFLGGEDYWLANSNMEEAALTIHEAGIEELLTRWQAVKEGRGFREKAASSLALLLYMEYAPFTGLRNMFIDGKEKSLDLMQDGRVRIPAKIATPLGILAVPMYVQSQTDIVGQIAEEAAKILPVTEGQVSGLISRGHSYTFIAALSAMFSSKQKGAFEARKIDEGDHLPTTEYKFPYVYNPITSVARAIGFMMYLSRTWDQIPNFRHLQRPSDIDKLKREIDTRVEAKLDDKQHQFTMSVVEDALRPFEGRRRSDFPQDAYVKGMFTPAMYVRLRDFYSH